MPDRQWTAGPNDAGLRLDKFLAAAERLGSRGRAAEALERGKIFLNGREAGIRAAAVRLAAGDVVRLWMGRPGSGTRRQARGAGRDLEIGFEEAALIVLNKPAGLLAVPLAARRDAPSVHGELARYLPGRGRRRPLVVHRIDRDTSGLVVFAKHADAQLALRQQ